MKFLLFDIDGTLIDTGGAGSRALTGAFQELFGVSDAFRTISMAGKTDLQIIREGMALSGITSENGALAAFCSRYLALLAEGMDGRGQVKPGVHDALEAIRHDGAFHLGLLTGNMEEGARIKLNHYGLLHFFDIGAFGDEHEDRNSLLPIAVEKLRAKRSITVGYGDCVVIGDTPRDVACARPYGARAVAVATGPYSYDALAAAEPDRLFSDFSDTAAVLAALRDV